MIDSILVDPRAVLVTTKGTDGHLYSVVPMAWTLDKIEQYWNLYEKFDILSDDVPRDKKGFELFIMTSHALWFEIVDLTQKVVIGLMFVSDLQPSLTERRWISALWHAAVWDAKAGIRLPVARESIKQIFKLLRLHRLEVIIPLTAGGAIRTAKKIGFIDEGVMRSFFRIRGEWRSALRMSIIENDTAFWSNAR